MSALRDFVLQTWFLCLASASAGLAVGVLLDDLAQRLDLRQSRKSAEQQGR